MMKVFVYEFYRITLEGCNFGAYIYEYFIELLYLCIWWLINAILSVPGLQFSKRFGKNAMVSERDLGIGKANDKQMRGEEVNGDGHSSCKSIKWWGWVGRVHIK